MERQICYKGIDFTCVFEIEPYVPAVLYGENSHPEEGGGIYDLEIYIESTEVSEILSDIQVEYIKELIYDKID
jgi:hypothetical protein